MIDRALEEGEVERVLRLPWGEGACFRQTATGRSQGPPGIFFATRTPPMADEQRGFRYWRYVELESEELVANDLQILRRIDPQGSEAGSVEGLDLEAAWERASRDIVAAHNERTDLRGAQEAIGPKQRWALDVLRDPGVALPAGADLASDALGVERSSAVGNALSDVLKRAENGALTPDQAAAEIVGVVEEFGLRPIDPPPLPEKIGVEDLGVVCWMAVLPPS